MYPSASSLHQPRSLVYYTGFDMWMPVYTSNGRTNILTALMVGGAGANRVDFATSLTTFAGAANGPSLDATFTFPTTTNDPVLISLPTGAADGPHRTGDYTATAIDEQGCIWGAGEVVGAHVNDNPQEQNWATVVFKLSGCGWVEAGAAACMGCC
jgi:hypothetical protein